MDCLAISPLVGVTYSHVWTKVDIPAFMLTNLNEKFVSWAPFIGFEICYTITKGLRLSGSFQYAWSRTHTTISKLPPPFGKTKSNSKGPTYSLLIEKDLSDYWSINFGAAYNLGLTKERHGLRATGVKIGVAYWF
jgi:hypothetical protein